ncbi:hypothetical protein [Christiangramia lutea]|nr:hypothetical protein [Christiangramia lutea]
MVGILIALQVNNWNVSYKWIGLDIKDSDRLMKMILFSEQD